MAAPCAHCGTYNPAPAAAYCQLCGRRLGEESSDSPEPQDELFADGQDPEAARRALSRIEELLTDRETIHYLAMEHRAVMNFSPACLVLTNRRFILHKAGLLGQADLQDHPWRALADAHLREGMLSATLTLELVDGSAMGIEHLPKTQARRAYAMCQQMQETAGAAPTHHTNPPTVVSSPSSGEGDPVERLRQLKQMIEDGLITDEEYQAKKSEVLRRM
jgi:hypothetical protein